MNDPEQPIRVWDWPVRIFHWSLAACVFIAFFTGESERFSLLHQTLGYVAGGLLAFRLVWGFVGTRHARFASFIKGPQAILAYVKSLRQAQPETAASMSNRHERRQWLGFMTGKTGLSAEDGGG